MDIFHVLVLSIVEGLTEFLPISSTAHQILASHLLQMPQTDFLATFEITIQLGAIAAVVVLFYKKILSDKQLFYKACIGFIPTGILGLLLLKHIKALLSSDLVPVIALFIGGIAIIAIEYYFKRKHTVDNLKLKTLSSLSYKDALIIGLIQSISMIPGVSRSAASIFGAMALKFDRRSSVEFSFLLAIPTMIVATGYDLVKSAHSFDSSEILYLIAGTLIAFITALIVIKWLIKYVQTNNFISFGIYRIIISIIYFLLFIH
jgi:undecaprenyl-diphosphatase